MHVRKEVAVNEGNLIIVEEQANKLGWDTRYGDMYQQLKIKKLRLRHMLYHCYCIYHDEDAGNLMDDLVMFGN
jgi:hypothetical protein